MVFYLSSRVSETMRINAKEHFWQHLVSQPLTNASLQLAPTLLDSTFLGFFRAYHLDVVLFTPEL